MYSLHTSMHVSRTQVKARFNGRKRVLLPIIFFTDATNLSHSGSHNAHPVFLTHGCMRKPLCDTPAAWQAAALLPKFNVSADVANSLS